MWFTTILLISAPAMAQVKHLVFDLEGVLVQGIPKKNHKLFNNKDQMIVILQKFIKETNFRI